VNPRGFILLGRSAGGQIASACAHGLRDPDIVGCVAIYAPHDMFFARRFAFEDDVLNSLRLLRNYLGGDPAEAETAYATASAFTLADGRSPPTLLIHGARDTLVWNMQSRRMAQRLRELGVRHLLVELPWAAHGMDWPFDGPGGQVTRIAVDGFLEAVCPP
jgi:acetyl esterase/lipase